MPVDEFMRMTGVIFWSVIIFCTSLGLLIKGCEGLSDFCTHLHWLFKRGRVKNAI